MSITNIKQPGDLRLYCYKGDDFTLLVEWKKKDGTAVDLSAYDDIIWKIYEQYGSDPIHTFSVTGGQVQVQGSSNELLKSDALDDTLTEQLGDQARLYKHAIQLSLAGQEITYIASTLEVGNVHDGRRGQSGDTIVVDEVNNTVTLANEIESAALALQAKDDSETAKTAAEAAQTAAETAETNAENAETGAVTAKDAAETAETNAVAAKNAAETAESNAETAETNAVSAKNAAETSESNAEASANAAATSESNALASENAAKTAENNAETAESNAVSAKNAAETAETNAANSASAASTSETNAAQSATDAENFKNQAEAAADQSLAQMSANIMQYLDNLTYNGLELTGADINWPDGATGTLTVDTWNSTWAAIDKYSATYDDGVNPVKTVVFEVTARNAVGEPTQQNFTVN